MPSASGYTVGATVRVSGTFRDFDGKEADPLTVTCEVKKPDGTVADYTNRIVKDAPGRYHFDFIVDAARTWYYRMVGSGGGFTIPGEGSFVVNSSVFP